MKVVLYDVGIKEVEELTAKIGWSSIMLTPCINSEVDDSKLKGLLKAAVKLRLGSVLDFPYYIFTFEGVSRAFTHQLVRHRMAAYVQQSLRRVKVSSELSPEDPWFIIPPSLVIKSKELILTYVRRQIEAGSTYLKLIQSGTPPEDARYVLPIGVKTFINCIMNAEELLHVIKVRTCTDAQWEIRKGFLALLVGLNVLSPEIFSYAGPHCVYDGKCRGRGNWSCFEKVKSLIGRIRAIAGEARKTYEGKGYLRLDLTELLGFKAPDELKKEIGKELGLEGPINLDYKVELVIRNVRNCLEK